MGKVRSMKDFFRVNAAETVKQPKGSESGVEKNLRRQVHKGQCRGRLMADQDITIPSQNAF